MKYLLALLIPVALFGCATLHSGGSPNLVSPTQLQSDIANLGGLAKPYLTAKQISAISDLKVAAQGLANGTVPLNGFESALLDATPLKESPALSLAFTAAGVAFTTAYDYYGLGNSIFTQYCTAFATGLAAAGY